MSKENDFIHLPEDRPELAAIYLEEAVKVLRSAKEQFQFDADELICTLSRLVPLVRALKSKGPHSTTRHGLDLPKNASSGGRID